MTLQQLKYVIEVAKAKSISEAAQKNYLFHNQVLRMQLKN